MDEHQEVLNLRAEIEAALSMPTLTTEEMAKVNSEQEGSPAREWTFLWRRVYYQENKEKIKAKTATWRADHADEWNVYQQRRRALMAGLPATLTVSEWYVIKEF